MGAIASAATQSAIATIAVVGLMRVAFFASSNPGDVHRLESVLRGTTDPVTLVSAALGWIAFSAWLWFKNQRPPTVWRSQSARVGWAVLETLLVSVAIVALIECVQFLRVGLSLSHFWWFSLSYLLRQFEAVLFAVVVVRVAFVLFPHFASSPPRNT